MRGYRFYNYKLIKDKFCELSNNKRANKIVRNSRNDNLFFCIKQAFIWSESKEGFTYWYRLNLLLEFIILYYSFGIDKDLIERIEDSMINDYTGLQIYSYMRSNHSLFSFVKSEEYSLYKKILSFYQDRLKKIESKR